MKPILFAICLLSPLLVHAASAKKACPFQSSQLAFEGSAVEQASCLLRPVGISAKVPTAPVSLPDGLAAIVGMKTDLSVDAVRAYLKTENVNENDVGGPLSGAVSHANAGQSSAPMARYFVIHDTSTEISEASFPDNNSKDINQLAKYIKPDSVAHVFVNRRGESMTGHDFKVPWRATKLESKQLGTAAKGLFLHIELVQPRRTDKSKSSQKFAVAPVPGFTDAQYRRLALLFTIASVRAGTWLVPAYHAVLDVDLQGHDDPQHFDLQKFATALGAVRGAIVAK
ncbi:MAG: hypothetical protein V4723_07340 [Pseudomonadota bacterium]